MVNMPTGYALSQNFSLLLKLRRGTVDLSYAIIFVDFYRCILQ